MNIRTVTASLAIAAVATVGLAAPVNAEPSSPGCPGGFQLMSVKDVLKDIAAEGFRKAIRSADANSDGKLCIKILPEPVDTYDPTFFYQDNDFPTA